MATVVLYWVSAGSESEATPRRCARACELVSDDAADDLDWQQATGFLSNETAPFIRWDIVQSFDSVKDCEGVREVLARRSLAESGTPGLPSTTAIFLTSRGYGLMRAENDRARRGKPVEKHKDIESAVLGDVATSSRCIASDDPRLRGKENAK